MKLFNHKLIFEKRKDEIFHCCRKSLTTNKIGFSPSVRVLNVYRTLHFELFCSCNDENLRDTYIYFVFINKFAIIVS